MIKEVSSPKLKNPIFIAAWPGMGEVAYRSALFLKEALGFKMFAKLEAHRFFKPAAVTVEKGLINIPNIPAGLFYFYKGKNHPDMIIFLGEAQPPLEYAEALSLAIVNFVKRYKTKLMFTFAAKPEPLEHKNNSQGWIASTNGDALKEFADLGLKVLKEGQISGLNGIILGVGKRKGINGACLLAEIPFYTVQIENPKAVICILEAMNKHFKLNLNISPIIERAKFIEEEIDKLISYLKGETSGAPPSPLSEEDIEKIKKDLSAYTKLPQSARVKIEGIFKEAAKDITLANKLKEELDHWNVYKEYEDRFLNLFKKDEKGKEKH
jgi:predicted ATP-grasp superfamily ATP-dependent carboligase